MKKKYLSNFSFIRVLYNIIFGRSVDLEIIEIKHILIRLI